MKLAIYIPDPTYDQENETEESSQRFKKQIEAEYGARFNEIDIGAGASWPAFLTFVPLDQWPYVAAAIGLLFSGKPINDNLEAWPKVAKKIVGFFKHRPLVDRQGAAIIAVDAVMKELGGLPRSIEIKGYKTTNHWEPIDGQDFDALQYDGIEKGFDERDAQRNGLPPQLIHWFDIASEGRLFRVSIDWNRVRVKEM